jgi:hypothetical protein
MDDGAGEERFCELRCSLHAIGVAWTGPDILRM